MKQSGMPADGFFFPFKRCRNHLYTLLVKVLFYNEYTPFAYLIGIENCKEIMVMEIHYTWES